MPNEDNKIIEYNHGEMSLKFPAIIYADFARKNVFMSKQPWNILYPEKS